jgi:D-alanyl-D-alanine carboxypeptidase
VLQAFEADKLRLDDVITKYLPGEITGRIANAEAITLHMLLSHRSGIAEWDTPDIDLRIAQTPTYIWTLDEILNLAAKNGPAFSPGQQYGYSNTNYALLGEILTRISGRDWRDVVREGVFAPARLHDTYLPQPGDHTCAEPCAHGYLELNDALVDLSNVDPSMAGSAGGHQLITTAADLTRFFEKLQGGALFRNASTLQTMFDFAVAPEPDSYITGYGLGMAKFEGDGFLAYGHLGGTAGYQSFMLYVPATKRYLTGFINLYGGLGDFLVPLLVRTQQP